MEIDKDIHINGVCENNLKNLNLTIPANKLVCVTGVSGCGKSSLVYDTIYAESRRVFLESMAINPYGQKLMEKPNIESISNLRPAIDIAQNSYNVNPRSTLGTVTDISHYLRNLYALLIKNGYSANDFSFNNPLKCCPDCKGLGEEYYISMRKLIPDNSKSLSQGAVSCFRGNENSYEMQVLNAYCSIADIDMHVPFRSLPQNHKDAILYENSTDEFIIKYKTPKGRIKKSSALFIGAYAQLEKELEKISVPSVFAGIKKYLEKRECSSCSGFKLSLEMSKHKIEGLNISEVEQLPLTEFDEWINKLIKSQLQSPLMHQIDTLTNFVLQKLCTLFELQLGYLSLGRSVPSLSGGEMQRVRIASHLTSSLIELLYILDEPCKGLHYRDVRHVVSATRKMICKGNSVIAIEHNEQYISNADRVFELGSEGGPNGGYLLREYSPRKSNKKDNILSFKSSPTINKNFININDIQFRTIQHENVKIPLQAITCITGVSGSGKSTLAEVVVKCLEGSTPIHCKSIENAGLIDAVSFVNQSPIGKTSRSTVVSYLGIYDEIRNLFATTTEAEKAGLSSSNFSMNLLGGRCETCQGTGRIKIELEYIPETYITCEMCNGKRFMDSILDVYYKNLNINDVLECEVERLLSVFQDSPTIYSMLSCLVDIGLGYIKLGQMSMNISGGEAQRIKLAKYLGKKSRSNHLFVLDEPTNGLAIEDVSKISSVLNRLIKTGNSLIIIEHNAKFIAQNADYIIDFGCFAGVSGGKIVFQGKPQDAFNFPDSSWCNV